MIKTQVWFRLMICLVCGTTLSLQGSPYASTSSTAFRPVICGEITKENLPDVIFRDSLYDTQMNSKPGNKAFREEFILSPASVKGNLNLKYATHRYVSFQIFDASGKLMFFRILDQGENSLYLKTGLPEGVYIYTIHGQHSEVLKTAKLVIVK